ncbi:DUF551 domain-containing protein [Enterobacter roggenkampii]|uniref:DUF551 domain-containing protein n=1 Tax=Enterobacter roggenkampii TaxID=1812935 RepID=UPI00215B6577|nr:DUF551 domain-containing protein [Enterobacter roggenkampii]
MSTITKERVANLLQFNSEGSDCHANAEQWEVHELARIALASLEAEPAIHRWRRVTSEPYGPYPWHYGDFIGFSKPVDGIEDEYFYSAPPAPANTEPVAWLWSHRKHPSEVTLVRPEDDERAEGAHWSGWSCQALYAAPPAPVSVPDDVSGPLAHAYKELTPTFMRNHIGVFERYGIYPDGSAGIQAMRIALDGINRRAAMLQGADGNSPVIPGGWVACSERMPENDDFVYIWPRPDFGVELHVAQYGKFDKRDAGWYAQVYEQNYGIEYYPVKVTHWMPLPAAPQQEAKP